MVAGTAPGNASAADARRGKTAGPTARSGLFRLHLTKHSLLWWGDEASGYNDYAVEAFCRDRGLKPLAPLPHPDAQALPCAEQAERGAAYAAWLRSDPALHKSWIQWRCDQDAAFYARLAAPLAAPPTDVSRLLQLTYRKCAN